MKDLIYEKKKVSKIHWTNDKQFKLRFLGSQSLRNAHTQTAATHTWLENRRPKSFHLEAWI